MSENIQLYHNIVILYFASECVLCDYIVHWK